MGNGVYEENKQLKRENENLREALRDKNDREAFPKMVEGCLWAFFQGRAALVIDRTPQAWSVRFMVDAPPPLPEANRSPTNANPN